MGFSLSFCNILMCWDFAVVPLVPIAAMLSSRGPPCCNDVSGWMGWLTVFFRGPHDCNACHILLG
jgi:hypothetical protein